MVMKDARGYSVLTSMLEIELVPVPEPIPLPLYFLWAVCDVIAFCISLSSANVPPEV